MRHFLLIAATCMAFSLAAQQPAENRRHYRPSRDFLENADENCFEATRREADRAFGQRCWDDASLLYRAAKNCADADQKRRQEMSDRLVACRAAAELELINRERQAIAANRADDANALLRASDRSLAYRMADFANNYIAPPDEANADCQQAMFDAWYLSPSITGLNAAFAPIQVPFCYELGENLGNIGEALVVRFTGKGDQKKIYAFSQTRHLLYNWDAQSLKPGTPVPVDPAVTGFEVAPDGHTFLFYSDNLLIFWRKGRELYRFNVPRIHGFSFDPKEDEFFLLDTIAQKIEVLSLREVYLGINNNKIQKQRKLEEVRIPPVFRPWISGIQPNLLDFAVYGGDVWLGYRDSIVVLRKPAPGKPWAIVRSIPMEAPVPTGLMLSAPFLELRPDLQLAFYGNDTASFVRQLPLDEKEKVSETFLPGYPLAAPTSGGLFATMEPFSYMKTGNIHIYNEQGHVVYKSAVQDLEFYSLMSAVLDPEGDWLIVPSSSKGVLHCWRLKNDGQNIYHNLATENQVVSEISPDGRTYIAQTAEDLKVYDCLEIGKVCGEPIPLPPGMSDISHKMSNHWIASRIYSDSLLVWNWQTGKKWYFDQQQANANPVVAFTSDERFIAVGYNDGQIRVHDLSSGKLVSTRPFSGQIQELMFVPGSNELIIVQANMSDYDYSEKTVLRIIHPFQADYRQRTMRLHEYSIMRLAVSDQGKYLAVSDGFDIRIFDLDNLADEMAQIMPTGEGQEPGSTAQIIAIRFHPDGRSLVATYSDQSVVFWNILTGQSNFRLQTPAESPYMFFQQLRIIPEENLLCLLSPNEALLIRSLDETNIRAAIQPPNYQLVAFNPDQIRKYQLDQALNYPGNFERLANSGDIPLINAFFSYYFQQARTSNNIDRVSEYCVRAFVLYSQLDTATQRELRLTMLEMYDNYHWKWLIRDRPDQADLVLQHLNRQFARPITGVLAEAHTALLRGGPEDLRKAVRLYADWAISMNENNYPGLVEDPTLNVVFEKFVQLAEFELLGDKQIDCLCGMFGDWQNFSLCLNRKKDAAAVPFDAETRLRWNIYKKMYQATQTGRFVERLQLLQQAQSDIRQLAKTKPALARLQMAKVGIQSGEAYLNWARSEQGGFYTESLARQGIAMLEGLSPAPDQEQRRLETLALLYYELANFYFNKNALQQADELGRQGYEISSKLWNITTDTFDLRRYSEELVGNQLVLLGNVRLNSGDWSTARKLYEQANDILTQGLNSYFTAHVDLLEGEEYAALINYGGIFNTEQLGNVVFDLARLAENFPDKKDSILQFIPRMRDAWLANHPRSSGTEADYRYARLQTQYAAHLEKFEEALQWNTQALHYAEGMQKAKNTAYNWDKFWSDAALNQSYYLLFNSPGDTTALTKAIQVAQAAEKKVLENSDGPAAYDYATIEYFRTNMAHAYFLRNQPGDLEKAVSAYRSFLALDEGKTGSYWDVLEKDFRDLHHAGLKGPDLKGLIDQIKPPYINLSAEEWQAMGVGKTGL